MIDNDTPAPYQWLSAQDPEDALKSRSAERAKFREWPRRGLSSVHHHQFIINKHLSSYVYVQRIPDRINQPNQPSRPEKGTRLRQKRQRKREEGKRAHTEEQPHKFTRIAIQGCERQCLKAPWNRAEIRVHGKYRAILLAPVCLAHSIQAAPAR